VEDIMERRITCPNPNCARHKSLICYYDGKKDKTFWCQNCGSEIQSGISDSELKKLLATGGEQKRDQYGRVGIAYGTRATIYRKGTIDRTSIKNREKSLGR